MKQIGRRTFLERAVKGGIGTVFIGLLPFADGTRWRERGVSFTSVRRSSLVMGSVIDIQAVAETEREGYAAIREAVGIFRDLDEKLTMYDADSEMGILAERAGRHPVSLSPDAVEVLKFAKGMWAETGGKFDITIEPAMKRWGFRQEPDTGISRPTDAELLRLERLIGSDKLDIAPDRAYLEQEGMGVDVGGIAGGYALDKAIARMKRTDVAAAVINFSGDIHCFGRPTDEEGWPVHIFDPRTRRPVENPVYLKNEALSTSGAYRNRRNAGNNDSWGHLLLPSSAAPAPGTGSVTAIHRSAMTADAWSTAGFVGAERTDQVRWILLE